jgi:CheY-like chemotaxis protein
VLDQSIVETQFGICIAMVFHMLDRKISILLIDDSEDILIPLQFLLNREGINTCIARNGLEALEMLKSNSFSLILLDYQMPKMNGEEFLRHKAELKNDTPVVLFSGVEGLEHSSSERTLPKPFRFNDVVGVVKDMVLRGA